MRSGCFVLALIWGSFDAASCLGQPSREPHLDLLIRQRSVQQELTPTPYQLREWMQTASRQGAAVQWTLALPAEQRDSKLHQLQLDHDLAVMKLLRPPQKERLQQIQWQLQGCRAFFNPELIDGLSLTQDQQFAVNIILDEFRGQANELIKKENGRFPSAETVHGQLVKLNKPAMEKIQVVLNTEQKDLLKQLLGKEFTGAIRFGPPSR